MPKARVRTARGPRAGRGRWVAGLLGCAFLFAACSGGGSGSDATLSGGSSVAAASTAVTLAWAEADGPVAGYSVYVQRDGGSYAYEGDVPEPAVRLSGPPGQRARLTVAAYDASGNLGPSSTPSPIFTFPAEEKPSSVAAEPPSQAAMTGAMATAAPAATARGSSESGSTSAETASSPADDPAQDPDAAEAAPIGVDPLDGTLVWQDGDTLRVTNGMLETQLLFTRPSPSDVLAAIGDFDGDDHGDLLWVTDAGELSYTSSSALLLQLSPTPAIGIGVLAPGETLSGTGDFDGDGLDDLLVGRAGGAVDVWFLAAEGSPEIVEIGATAGAVLAAVGDLDANGADDLVWRSPDGVLAIWPMGSRTDVSVEVALDAGLEVLAAGDFDANGADELAVRDAQGDVFLLFPLAVPAAFAVTDLADAGGWRSMGSADLDRDGDDELVLVANGALRTAALPGDELRPLDPASPWQLVALLP